MCKADRICLEETQNPREALSAVLVELSQQALLKNHTGVADCAGRALCIAKAEESPLMTAIVHLRLANAELLLEAFNPALTAFRQATVQAKRSRNIDVEMATELELQSLIGEAGVFFAMNHYSVAGEIYREAAELAEGAGQYPFVLDSWLMAGMCFELRGRFVDAYRCYEFSLLAGETMGKAERPKEGLSLAGDALLRIGMVFKTTHPMTISPTACASEQEVERRMTDLIGDDWRGYLRK